MVALNSQKESALSCSLEWLQAVDVSGGSNGWSRTAGLGEKP